MRRTLLYCLIVILINGQSCKKESGVQVHCDNLVNEVLPAGDQGVVLVASAFTPNGDGLNDLFKPYVFNVSSVSIRVYDENSNLVFQTNQAGAGWNPSPAPGSNQTFYFRVEAVTLTNHRIGQCGEVHALFCYPRNSSANGYKFEDQITPFGFTGITNESISSCN